MSEIRLECVVGVLICLFSFIIIIFIIFFFVRCFFILF